MAFGQEFALEGLTLAVIVVLFWTFMKKGILNDRDLIQPILWHLMILIGIGVVILAFCKRLSYKGLVSVILLAGLMMRIGFVLYKPTYTAYHDLGEITTVGYYGHASYVLKIFETGALPLENAGQYYHPPFFHILAACAMKVTGKVLSITDEVYLFESAKIISCAATCFTLLTARKILKELALGKTATVIALSVCAFLPIHYMLGGWVNNDALVTFFMTWIILYTIRWYRNPTYQDFLCAFCRLYGYFHACEACKSREGGRVEAARLPVFRLCLHCHAHRTLLSHSQLCDVWPGTEFCSSARGKCLLRGSRLCGAVFALSHWQAAVAGVLKSL